VFDISIALCGTIAMHVVDHKLAALIRFHPDADACQEGTKPE